MSVHCFEGVSLYATMHNDVCSLAIDLHHHPFPQALDKRDGGGDLSLRHLNKNVLDKAPCSVGVLIDRGNPQKFLTTLRVNKSLYRVAVLFFEKLMTEKRWRMQDAC